MSDTSLFIYPLWLLTDVNSVVFFSFLIEGGEKQSFSLGVLGLYYCSALTAFDCERAWLNQKCLVAFRPFYS